MSVEIKGLRLWHDTNYCGKGGLRGFHTSSALQHRFPNELRFVPRLILQFGNSQKSPKFFSNRVTLTDHDLLKNNGSVMLWDLYFVSMQNDGAARLVLLPRNVFGTKESIHQQGLMIGWKYVGRIVPSLFRWDLYLVLEKFFGSIPHCVIDTFIPGLQEVIVTNNDCSKKRANWASSQAKRSGCEQNQNQSSHQKKQNKKGLRSKHTSKSSTTQESSQTKQFGGEGKENQLSNQNQSKKKGSRLANTSKSGARRELQGKQFCGERKEDQSSRPIQLKRKGSQKRRPALRQP